MLDENSISRSNAEQFSVLVSKALKRSGGCEYLILVGLSEEQKSFLTFLNDYNTIEIADVSEVDFFLSEFAHNKGDFVECSADSIQVGLYYAMSANAKLKIVTDAAPVRHTMGKKEGIIVVERTESVASIIAVNNAVSVRFDIKVVAPLKIGETYEIKYLIEEWKNGSATAFDELADKINSRIGNIEFTDYKYASFFTEGLPYVLTLADSVISSHVHMNFRPDFFVFNGIYFKTKQVITSAVVFSPPFFTNDETSDTIVAFQKQHYYVRELVGKNASVFNIDMHVKEFPYGMLHVCSHGGEVPGYALSETFIDRDGNSHVIEFDQVVSFTPSAGQPLIPVQIKDIWRKFNGLIWRSPELKARGIPQHVFIDMQLAIDKSFKNNKQPKIHKANVPGSCSIKCSDFIYQAMFDVVAEGHTSPVVFNNSCWSWSGVSDSFLRSGVRGYIGTLCDIDNGVATKAAKVFYRELFNTTVVRALKSSAICAKGTPSEDVYLYWGLHFTSVKTATDVEKSKEHILRHLLHKFTYWTDAAKRVKDVKMRDRI